MFGVEFTGRLYFGGLCIVLWRHFGLLNRTQTTPYVFQHLPTVVMIYALLLISANIQRILMRDFLILYKIAFLANDFKRTISSIYVTPQRIRFNPSIIIRTIIFKYITANVVVQKIRCVLLGYYELIKYSRRIITRILNFIRKPMKRNKTLTYPQYLRQKGSL